MDLTITSKLDCRISHPPGVVIAPIAINDEREQWPQCRNVGDWLAVLVRPVNVGADEPAERAVLIEHGATTHPSVKTSADPVAGKGQHNSVTVPFMDLVYDADARHELIVDNDVELTICVPGCSGRTAPVAKSDNSLAYVRCEGTDDRGVSREWTLEIASPRIRRNMEKGDIRCGMGDRRDDVPNYVVGAGQYLNCDEAAVGTDTRQVR